MAPCGGGNEVYVIDAYVKGNVGRFLNHACGPSSEANVSPVYVFVMEKAPVRARRESSPQPKVAPFSDAKPSVMVDGEGSHRRAVSKPLINLTSQASL